MTQELNANLNHDEMLNFVSDAFFSLDRDLYVTNVNNLFLSWFGITREDAIGRHLDHFSSTESERLNFRRRYSEVLETGTPTRFFENYGKITVEINAFKTSSNELAIFFKDITLVELARKNLSRIFEHAPAAFALIEGESLTYTLTNNKFMSLFGERPEEVVPKEMIQNVLRTGDSQYMNEVKFKDHYLSHALEPYYDYAGKRSGVVLVCHDITEVVQAKKRAEEAVSIREEFLSLASHELKTPLTTLHLQNEITRKILSAYKVQGADQERLEKTLDIIENSVQRLNSLIDSMLDVSKIHNGKLVLDRGDYCLNDIVANVVSNLSMQLERQGFRCEIFNHARVWAHCDSFRLEQVVANLLINSMKYASPGLIKIEIHKIDCQVRISVRDQGLGIPESELQKIFLRFEQAHNTKTSGLGLGLYICKEIVTAHYGEIKVESRTGEGSTFTVSLPSIDHD